MPGILFRRNLESQLINVEAGEIVYAIDSDKWGLGLSDGSVSWRNEWELDFTNNYLSGEITPTNEGKIGDYYADTVAQKIYQKQELGWEEIVFPIDDSTITQIFIPKGSIPGYDDTSTIILDDGTVKLPNGYSASDPLEVVTKKEIDTALKVLKDDGTTQMDDGYEPQSEDDVVTLINAKYNETLYKPPTAEPTINGTLWNNNGNLEVYQTPGHIRYYTTASSLDFSILGTLQTTNGYVDVVSNDNPILQSNQATITKIEVLKYGNRTSWHQLAGDCSNMTEFVVTATDASKVSDFSYAWQNCSSLPHCPAGNEVTIPQGATTTDMCTGI